MFKVSKGIGIAISVVSFFMTVLYCISDYIVFSSILNNGYTNFSDSILALVGLPLLIGGVVLLALGITGVVFAVKLPKGTAGRGLMLAGTIMTIAGIVTGYLNIIRIIFVLAQGIVCLIASIQIGKQVTENNPIHVEYY